MSRATDDATRKRILDLASKGGSDRTIGAAVGVSHETVRRIRNAARAPLADGLPPAGDAPPPATAAPRPPPGLAGVDLDLWIIDHEIEATREQLADARQKARDGGSSHGLASLGSLLASLLDRRAKIRPAPPPDEATDERQWRADADAVLRQIEAGVRAAEGRAA